MIACDPACRVGLLSETRFAFENVDSQGEDNNEVSSVFDRLQSADGRRSERKYSYPMHSTISLLPSNDNVAPVSERSIYI